MFTIALLFLILFEIFNLPKGIKKSYRNSAYVNSDNGYYIHEFGWRNKSEPRTAILKEKA